MNIFQNVKNPNVPRNTFDLSHDHKFTCDFGHLIPAGCWETYPGDLWKINTQVLSRTLAMLSPVMHLVEIDVHYYKVPIRVLYPDFDDIIAPPDPDLTPPVPPHINNLNDLIPGDIGDYLGLPTDSDPAINVEEIVAYPIIAYTRIYDYWYRDQNLQAEATGTVTAGLNTWARLIAYTTPLFRAWNHDYFTSCLPFAQKGDVVTLPLTENQTIDVEPKTNYPLAGQAQWRQTVDGSLGSGLLNVEASGGGVGSQGDVLVGNGLGFYDPDGTLEVSLNDVAQDIITVRTAFKIQEFLEMDARAGTRYKEVVYAHFDVKTKDGRLQEPEYIGGQKSMLKISEVLSTAQTIQHNSNTVINPVGELSGHGISVDGGKTITTYCREHGYIMAIYSARPRTAYQQGIHKMWSRKERLDYPWPSLAHVGEQPVYGKELYINLTDPAKLDTVFGYIPRYSELKFLNSRVSGLMQSTFTHWHLGRIFTSEPALNSDFIECNPDKRIFAVTSEPSLMVHMIFNISCTRNFPMFSTPKL